MSTTMWFRTAIAFAALFGSALTSSAQTAATPADAAPFVGTWVLTLETPQGNLIPMKITLTPDGEQMKFGFDAAGGQFFIEGAATKK